MGAWRTLGLVTAALLLVACGGSPVMCAGCFSEAWVNVERLPHIGAAGTLRICAPGTACQRLPVSAGTAEVDSVALDLDEGVDARDMGGREVTATLRIGQLTATSTTRLTFVDGEGECGCDVAWGALEW